jgi:eukaryotic-like serine/threonine-protein kinase
MEPNMVGIRPDLEAIFFAARQKAPKDRAAYLDEVCRDDAELRQRVDQFLSAQAELGSFLESPAAAPPMATMEEPIREMPGTMIGPYKLLQQIGEGGMGTVYMAEQTQPVQRRVALKVIKAGLDSKQVIARFEAERQALAVMDHVNIARVFDAGATEAGRPYFVMELVHGVPITKYCDDNHLTPRERLELFVPVCQAIQHAHQKGIIHRDIKPSNVMITLYDGKPVPKVIDFGVAKATEQKLTERTLFTQYGAMVGTLEYMSPEQAEMSGLGVDTRSDIYSLGVLLYELLTGNTPLTHKRMKDGVYAEILRMIKEEEPPKPSTRLSDSGEALASISAQRHTEPAKLTKLMRGELDWIVMKTLEKDRNRRYETANGFAADVQRYLADEPVQACPASASYRLRKFVRRNKRVLATAALFGVLMLAAVGTMTAILGWAARDREALRHDVARDQETRQQALAQEITRALDETAASYKRGKWPEAMAAVKRAGAFVASGSPDEVLAQRVRQWRADLDLVSRLEDIRMERAADAVEDSFDWKGTDAAYAKVFQAYGLDVEAVDTAESAKRIVASGVKENLVAALDDWILTKQVGSLPGVEPLRVILGRADLDPWRNRVREALVSRDTQTLKKLSLDKEVLALPPTTVHLLGVVLAETGQVPLAVEVLRQAQDRYPGDFWINHDLGVYSYFLNPPQAGRAVAYLRAAVALRPESARVFVSLGLGLWKQREPVEAEAAFRKALHFKPDYPRAHLNLGVVLREQGKLDEGETEYREAVRLKPDYHQAHINLGVALSKQGKLDEAIACYRKAIEVDPNYAGAHYNLGLALRDQKKLDEAIVAFRKAIELDPTYVDAHNWLGALLCNDLQEYDKAIACFRKAIELDPKSALGYLNLGIALRAQRKLDDAIAAYRKAIEIDPKSADAHYNLGNALREQKRLPEAIAAYHKAIELEPTYVDAHNWLGAILCDELQDYDKAIACFRKAIELNPKHAYAYGNLGKALRRQGKLDEAIAAYRKAIEIDPKSADAYTNLGALLCDDLKDYDKAIECFRTAIKLDPKHARAYRCLGVALTQKGWGLVNGPDPKRRDPKRALEAVKETVELAPQSGMAWQWLGWVQYRTGNWKPSIEALEKSCKLQQGSTGDAAQWIVLALAHAKLAAQEGLPEKERAHHQAEARRRYEQADKQIDTWWRARPGDVAGQAIWDFRAEARELMKKESGLRNQESEKKSK